MHQAISKCWLPALFFTLLRSLFTFRKNQLGKLEPALLTRETVTRRRTMICPGQCLALAMMPRLPSARLSALALD